MAQHRTRKNKQSPHYNFLYSWTPDKKDTTKRQGSDGKNDLNGGLGGSYVKRETATSINLSSSKLSASKKADILAKEDSTKRIRKDIIKSLMLVGFVLALEIVVYLARHEIRLP